MTIDALLNILVSAAQSRKLNFDINDLNETLLLDYPIDLTHISAIFPNYQWFSVVFSGYRPKMS